MDIRIACAFVALVAACGDTETSTGPTAGAGGAAGAAASAGAGGEGGGAGGAAGIGGVGGEPRTFTSSEEWKDSELVYQRARCQCQDAEPISESACLALGGSLPLSDRQDLCFDEIVLNEELMTLETRLECLVTVNQEGASCLSEVDDCDPAAVADCEATTTDAKRACPVPIDDIIPLTAECSATLPEDGVDAFLDAREARCDCLTTCMNAQRDPLVVGCMNDTLDAEVGSLGPDGPAELACFTEFWRKNAVCFGNETTCDGAITACSDLPPMLCAIDATLLDACLTP